MTHTRRLHVGLAHTPPAPHPAPGVPYAARRTAPPAMSARTTSHRAWRTTGTSTMQDHEIAAHRLADAYETIARELPNLTDEQLATLFTVFHGHDDFRRIVADASASTAERYRTLAPFEPLNEFQRRDMAEQIFSELCGGDVYDHVRDHMDRPEWQLRAEWDDRCTWDHDNDNG